MAAEAQAASFLIVQVFSPSSGRSRDSLKRTDLRFRNRSVAGETTFLEMRIKSATLSGLQSPGPAGLVSVARLLAGRPLRGPTVAVPARITLRNNCADVYRFCRFSGVRSFGFELIRLFASEKALSQDKCSGGGCKQYLPRVRKPPILGADGQISFCEQMKNEDDLTLSQYSYIWAHYQKKNKR